MLDSFWFFRVFVPWRPCVFGEDPLSFQVKCSLITRVTMKIAKCLVILLLFPTLLPESIRADLDMQVLPGFDGYHKYGRWMHLRIALTSVDEDGIEGEVIAESQDGRQIYSVPITLFKAARKVQHLYVFPEGFRRNLSIKLIDDGKEVLQSYVPLQTISPEDLLIAVVSDNSGGLDVGKKTVRTYVSYMTAGMLPDRWKGYDPVDVIVLGDVSLNTLSREQRKAIRDWVYGGGRLVVSGGAHSQNLVGTFVEELLPVRINGTRVLNSISSLSRQFGSGIESAQIVVASSELNEGSKAIAVEDDGLPIIAERDAGDGNVIFLAFDYLDPAFRAWDGRIRMWEGILPLPTPEEPPRDSEIARLFASTAVKPPPYRSVGIFLLLYILCLGPISYVIVRNRAGWMWLLMLSIAAVFILCSLGFNYVTMGHAAVVSDFSVVDFHPDAGRAHVSSYFSLFSPAKSDYTLRFPASEAMFVKRIASPDRRVPQDGDCKLVQKDIFQVEISHRKTLLPLMFYGESYVDLKGSISIDSWEELGDSAQGKVISKLPFDLSDCYMFSNGRYAFIGDLRSGSLQDWNQPGRSPGLYSTGDEDKQRFINAIRQSLADRIRGTGVVGWMDESVLKTLVKMDMGEEYKSQGTALIIVHIWNVMSKT